MGNNQFRSEQSRKNYEKQERRRIAAAKRKELKGRKDALIVTAKAWLKENRQPVIKWTAIAAAVILVVWLGCKFFVGPGGSLPNFFGHLRGVEDSWVVTDLNPRSNVNAGSSNMDNAPRSKTPRYFHLATLNPLPGFTQDVGFAISEGEHAQDQHYTANEPGGLVESVYVFGIPNKTAEKHAGDMVSTMSLSSVTSEVMTAQIAGFDTRYVYFVFDGDPNEMGETTEAYASLCLCIDTQKDACVLVILNSYMGPKAEVPTVDALVEAVGPVLENLTVY